MTHDTIQFDAEQLNEAFEYLDELRKSGRTNMMGAAYYVQHELCWPREEARAAHSLWMKTFTDELTLGERVAKALGS